MAGRLLDQGTPHALTSVTAAAMRWVDAPETTRPKLVLANSGANPPSSCRRESRGAHGDLPHATRMRGTRRMRRSEKSVVHTKRTARFMFECPRGPFDWGARRPP